MKLIQLICIAVCVRVINFFLEMLQKELSSETFGDHVNVKRTSYCANCWIEEKFKAINLLFYLLFMSSKIMLY